MSEKFVKLVGVLVLCCMLLAAPGLVRADGVARHAVVGNDVFLEGEYLSVGISGAGSFGTSNSAPAGFHPTPYYDGCIGLSVDQDGFDTGNPPRTGDFFLPGTPEERFNVGYTIGGTTAVYTNAQWMGDAEVVRESVSDLSSGDVLQAQWVGSTPDSALRVTQVIRFRADQRFFRNTVTLKNTGTTKLDAVRYMRNVDPDQDEDVSYTFTTTNEITLQQPADGKALVRASGLVTGDSIFYYSTDARARVSTFGFTNTDPYDPPAYDQPGVYDGDSWIGAYGTVVEDQAISICADLGTLQPGQEQTFVYYTSLDADVEDALDDIGNEAAYTIHASAGVGGTISPVGNTPVYEDAEVSFLITATPGNMIASVLVDGSAVPVTDLAEMLYTFTGVTANHTIHATFMRPDVMAPVIDLPDGVPQGGVGSSFTLHLVVTDDRSIADVGVYENGVRVGGSLTGGDIHLPLTLGNGRHNLVIVATDNAGHRTEQTIILSVDTMPPALQVDALPSSVTSSTLSVSGSARDAVSGLAHFTINGEPVTPYLDGSFTEKLTLAKGVNTIVVEATDKVGNTTSQTFTVTCGTPSSAPSSLYVLLKVGSANMEVNGMPVALDAAPFIKDGRTLLPIRALIETLGGTVQWNAQTKTATVALGSRTVALTVGSTKALVNGSPVTLDVAPMIVKGRTFLPLRAVAESLGLDLAWDAGTQTISLTYWP